MKARVGQHWANRKGSTDNSLPVVNWIYYLGDLSLRSVPRVPGPSLVKEIVVRVNRAVTSENCVPQRKPLINGSSGFFFNEFFLRSFKSASDFD